MNRLDLCPLQESYAVQFGCSVQRDALPGGFSRYTTVTPSKKHLVSISYNLTEPDYHYFRAFYLNWQLNPLPFLMKLYIEDSEFKDYICQFVPDSFSLDGLSGKIFSVSAELVVVISPVVVLTSKTYPLFVLESIETNYELDVVVQKQLMNETEKLESLETSFAITAATVREALNTYVADVQCIEAAFGISGAQITVDNKPPTYITGTIPVEIIEMSFGLMGAQITLENKPPVYISTSIDLERIETTFAITGAQITN